MRQKQKYSSCSNTSRKRIILLTGILGVYIMEAPAPGPCFVALVLVPLSKFLDLALTYIEFNRGLKESQTPKVNISA